MWLLEANGRHFKGQSALMPAVLLTVFMSSHVQFAILGARTLVCPISLPFLGSTQKLCLPRMSTLSSLLNMNAYPVLGCRRSGTYRPSASHCGQAGAPTRRPPFSSHLYWAHQQSPNFKLSHSESIVQFFPSATRTTVRSSVRFIFITWLELDPT